MSCLQASLSVPLFNSKSNKLEPCITIIITIIIICIYMQVESMSKVQEEKDEVERLLAEYKEMLDVEKREHTVEVSVLERRNITEKDRLRSEMLRKIRETKLHLLAMTEDQLHATTKRTIMENEQMTSELQYQSRQTERVLTEHNKLVKENKDLKRRIELHTQAQGMLVDRSRGFQNKIKKLSSSIPQHSRGSLEEDLKVEPSDPTRTPPSPPPSALPPPHLVSFPLPIPSCSLAVFPRFPPCFHCILLFLTFFARLCLILLSFACLQRGLSSDRSSGSGTRALAIPQQMGNGSGGGSSSRRGPPGLGKGRQVFVPREASSMTPGETKRALLDSDLLLQRLAARVGELERLFTQVQQANEAQDGLLGSTVQESAQMLALQDEALTFLLMATEDVKRNSFQNKLMALKNLKSPGLRQRFLDFLIKNLNSYNPQQSQM